MRSRTLIFIAACAIAGMCTGIFYAIYIDYQREPTFDADATPWPKGTPVAVGWEGALWGHDDDIKAAISQINREVGCPVLAPSGTTGQITMRWLQPVGHACGVTVAPPLPELARAGTWRCKNDTVDIQFRDIAHPENRFPTIVHELGHALGLAHDDSGDSVMRAPSPPMIPGRLAPGFTWKDARALRAKLCP